MKRCHTRQSLRRAATSAGPALPLSGALCESPRRRSVDQIVVSEPAVMPRCVRVAWISLSVMPGMAVISPRSSASWPSSKGYGNPPIFAGAVLPVRRTRRRPA